MTGGSPDIKVARIVRVNHAGEYGAIRIYGAQIFVSNFLWKAISPILSELKTHEIEHCQLFRNAMPARQSRPCRTIWLWSFGGSILGLFTALMGPKVIWACTEVVEKTVHRHLAEQINYLSGKDDDLRDLIRGIQAEEEGHLTLAQQKKGAASLLTSMLEMPINWSVDAVIWLSTWGDSARMRRDLAEVRP